MADVVKEEKRTLITQKGMSAEEFTAAIYLVYLLFQTQLHTRREQGDYMHVI